MKLYKLTKNLNIKKRLVISNILMIVIPVVICSVIGIAGLQMVWNIAVNGTIWGFEDSEDFYERAEDTAKIVEEIILDNDDSHQSRNKNRLDKIMKSNMMSVNIYENNEIIYQQGNETLIIPENILDSAERLGNECTIIQGEYCLYAHVIKEDLHTYQMFLVAKTSEPSYTTLKICIVIMMLILIVTVILSIYFTNRFLTGFVFGKIRKPLEILEYGVGQIRDGNLDYRIDYSENDEFSAVCDAFNEMAVRLKKSVDSALKNEQSQKELLAGISHDIRSPLTSIQGYVEGLLDNVADTPEKQRKYLMTIKQKSESISNMVSQIFTFSKMQIDDYPVNIVHVDIKAEIERIIFPLRDEYEHKGLKINLNVQSAELSVDTQLLNRICVNLISNSLKYNNESQAEINIFSEIYQNRYILHFADNGQGVDEQALDKLFDVFYRSDPARNSPDKKGSGLGLAIVANAVKRMNGTVQAQNVTGGGLDIIIKFIMEVDNE
ncbi:MAG: HAMP domain-containing histidine kinase [Ruminococcus sp.]|nr:HAMP domain-containing histidine kinase [Ruminococcus sp.]